MKRLFKDQKYNIYYGSRFERDSTDLFEVNKLKNKKVILITGAEHFKQTDNYLKIKSIIAHADCVIVNEIVARSNPAWTEIEKFKNIDKSAGLIISVGGGSVIDFGKALKLFFLKNWKMLAIYTLPGSASVVTPFAIFDNHEFKIGEYSSRIIPNYTYINKNIISKIPNRLIECAMFDIFAHTVESYFSKASTKESRRFAELSIIHQLNLIKSNFTDPLDIVLADIYAGLSERIGLVLFPHAVGHYLTYKYKIPHNRSSMYFLKLYLNKLYLNRIVPSKDIVTIMNYLELKFNKYYKEILKLSKNDIEQSFELSKKYMPFIFLNSPIPFAKRDYYMLIDEYEKNH